MHFFTAWVGDAGVGSLWLCTLDPMAFVYDVVVDEAQRRKGYGAAIMNAGALWSREQGHPVLGLNVFAHNPGARALYDRLGLPRHPGLPRARRAGCRLTRPGPSTSTPTSARRSPTTRGCSRWSPRPTSPAVSTPARPPRCGRSAPGRPDAGSWSERRCPTATGRASGGSRVDVPYDVLRDEVAEQVATLDAIARQEGTTGALPEAARCALPPGDRRPGAGGGGAGRVGEAARARASPGRGSWRSPRRPAVRRTSRGSPTAATATAGFSTAPSPVPCSRATTRSRPRPSTSRREVASLCVHGDSPGRGRPRSRRTSRARGRWILAPSLPAGPLTSPQHPVVSCGGSGRSCGRPRGSVEDTPGTEDFPPIVGPNLLRGWPRRA